MYSQTASPHAVTLPGGIDPSRVWAMASMTALLFYFCTRAAFDPLSLDSLFLLATIQAIPLVYSIARGSVNALGIVFLCHGVTYCVGKYVVLVLVRGEPQLSPLDLNEIIALITCTLLSSFSYGLLSHFFAKPSAPGDGKVALLKLPNIIALGLEVFLLAYPWLRGLLSIEASQLGDGANAIAFALLLTSDVNQKGFLSRSKNFILLYVAFVSFLESGLMGQLFTFLLVSVIVNMLRKTYRNFVWLTLLLVCLAYVQSFKGPYRQIIWQPNQALSLRDRFEAFAFVASEGMLGTAFSIQTAATSEGESDGENDSVDEGTFVTLFGRVADESLKVVLEKSPSPVPFWNGRSYEGLIYFYVPRVLLPSKPRILSGNEFGMLYGFLGEQDQHTSIAASYLAEAYMNFGFVGLYVVAFLFGCWIYFLEWVGLWYFGKRTILGTAIFLSPVLLYATPAQIMIQPAIQSIVFLIPVRKYLRRLVE